MIGISKYTNTDLWQQKFPSLRTCDLASNSLSMLYIKLLVTSFFSSISWPIRAGHVIDPQTRAYVKFLLKWRVLRKLIPLKGDWLEWPIPDFRFKHSAGPHLRITGNLSAPSRLFVITKLDLHLHLHLPTYLPILVLNKLTVSKYVSEADQTFTTKVQNSQTWLNPFIDSTDCSAHQQRIRALFLRSLPFFKIC